jgi:SPP1 family predicted phage head-tail adaptor
MRAGRLRHRCILQSKTYTQDAYGAEVVTFSTEATVWGAIEPLSGKEFFSQDSVQAEARVRIVIRYYSGVLTTWRVKHEGLLYDIKHVQNQDTRDRTMELMCGQGVTDDGSDAVTQNVVSSGVLVVNSGTQVVNT